VDADDAWHRRVVDWWRTATQQIVVPVCVLPEVAYLLHTRIGPAAEAAFIQGIVDGEFVVEPLDDDDIQRAAVLVREYTDLPLGFVDAAVIATAERLKSQEVLTTDRRHFSVVRPRHVRRLVLLP
jgi:predicted nucleic acid-binding protein